MSTINPYESESSLPELLADARQKERQNFINKLKGLKMAENKKVKTKSFQFVADAMVDMANFQAKRFNTKIDNLIKEYE